MKSLIAPLVAAIAVCCAPAADASISLNLGFDVTSRNVDPGLVVHTGPSLAPSTLEFAAAGDSITTPLFRIWTDENSVTLFEDTTPYAIDVAFDFGSSLGDFGGVLGGDTNATGGLLPYFPYIFFAGSVVWDGAIDLFFGPNGDGQLRIELSDELFNARPGFGQLREGEAHGANVNATFTLVNVPSAPILVTPEPAAVIVWSGLALAGVFAAYRRRS